MLSFRTAFIPKQMRRKLNRRTEEFIDHHDDREREDHHNGQLEPEGDRQLDDEVIHKHDHGLMQDVEGQNCLAGVSQEWILEVEIGHSRSQSSQDERPGGQVIMLTGRQIPGSQANSQDKGDPTPLANACLKFLAAQHEETEDKEGSVDSQTPVEGVIQ